MTPVGQSYLLFQLQQIDSQGDGALQRIQELDTRLADRAGEAAADHDAQAHQGAMHDQQRELRDLELQLGSVQEKLTTEERRLYAGRGAPRSQLQSLHQEVESLQSRVTELEDAVLVAMEAVEEAEAAAAAAAQRAAAAQAAGEQNRKALGQREGGSRSTTPAATARPLRHHGTTGPGLQLLSTIASASKPVASPWRRSPKAVARAVG